MQTRFFLVIALLTLGGCGSQYAENTMSPLYTPQADDSPATRFRQECLNGGYDEQSKEFFDCMESQWFVWKNSSSSVTANNQETNKEYAKLIELRNKESIMERKSELEQKQLQLKAQKEAKRIQLSNDSVKCKEYGFSRGTNAFAACIMHIQETRQKEQQRQDGYTAQQKAAWAQQEHQNQVQQQQHEAARSSAMTQGMLGILQNHMQQRQQRQAYIPPPRDIKTECSTYYGKTTCYTDR